MLLVSTTMRLSLILLHATCAVVVKHLQEEFVIADSDRTDVIDDGMYGKMRSGEYWRRNPKAKRLFLVLDSISAP